MPDTIATLDATADHPATLARAADTARAVADASLTANTRRAYGSARRRRDRGTAGRPLSDARLRACLGALFDAGQASASARVAASAAACRARCTAAGKAAGIERHVTCRTAHRPEPGRRIAACSIRSPSPTA